MERTSGRVMLWILFVLGLLIVARGAMLRMQDLGSLKELGMEWVKLGLIVTGVSSVAMGLCEALVKRRDRAEVADR